MHSQKTSKHIGIVGITTVGACICANEIVAAAARQDIDNTGIHPEFTLHAFSFDLYKICVQQKNWSTLADIILKSINKLKSAGADFIIIPSNTPHYAIDKIQNQSPLPVLNLIEITADECQRRGFKKVAILGTKSTMREGLYHKVLETKKIIPVIPEESLCDQIDDLIMNEIIPSKINLRSVQEIAEKIKHLKCDAVILGRTELPEVYHENNLNLPCIDTTRLLAQKALAFAKM